MGIVLGTGPGSRRSRAAGAVFAAALLCAGAAGCGAGKSGAGKSGAEEPRMAPAAAVRAAAKKTEKLTSMSYRMSGTTLEDGGVEGEGAMTFDPPAMWMKARSLDQGPDMSVEFRLTGGKLYLGGGAIKAGFDEESSPELDGKSWLATDSSAMGKGGTGAAGQGALTDRADKNPAEESTFLSDSDNVRRIGDETIDGVRTTHYRGTVTLAQMRASLKDEDAETRKRREKSLRQYEDLGVDRLAMDMWIDQDSHTKRFRTRGKNDDGNQLDVTITVLDINKPVTVEAPPASDTFDLADLTRGLAD
ncbi:DUF1396 domain-containing protein [Streptomyces sp. NPDC021098]|uniref:DUF1396 domain-containing protein n=1 Tax=unclassified Streptomyces TaxID=2593676 RepID=UPI00379F4B54